MSSAKDIHTTEANRKIRFLLDGSLLEIKVVDPTITVLEFLRDDLNKKATKEGCAEGDCGACTVVIAEEREGRLRFRSINSCIQFLPTLDGKAIYTVEGLRRVKDGELHPVQRAMVDCHASQCGFCTPGFVMSLFTLFKSQASPSRNDIDDALAGNLCRCTGYRPIISAASRMYEYAGQSTNDDENFISLPCSTNAQVSISEQEQKFIDQLNSLKTINSLSIDDKYYAPTSTNELAELFAKYPEATLLVGGTDVGLWVTKQYRELPRIIYLGQVEELETISISNNDIIIGAGVNLSDAFIELVKHFPDLSEIARRFASPPIRNAGTLCGNIANGSPIGDSMPALISLGARVLLRCGDAKRELSLDKFYLGYQKKYLTQGEFVESVCIPLPKPEQHFRSYKISKRFDQDISAVCAAYSICLSDGKVEDVRICYGGMAAIPQRAALCEKALLGKSWELKNVEAAIVALAKDFEPLTDMRATADYRLRVASNLLVRFHHETLGSDETTTQVLSYGTIE